MGAAAASPHASEVALTLIRLFSIPDPKASVKPARITGLPVRTRRLLAQLWLSLARPAIEPPVRLLRRLVLGAYQNRTSGVEELTTAWLTASRRECSSRQAIPDFIAMALGPTLRNTMRWGCL
jgi:hypothetical protein